MAEPPHAGQAPAFTPPATAAAPARRTRGAFALGVAALLSAPGVVLAIGALAYILHSIATESWYRHMFLAYGVRLAILYATFTAGIAAAFLLASGRAGRAGPRARLAAIAVAIAGIGAALLLEAEFWGEAGTFVPHGWFAGPFAAWAAAAGVLRLRHAAPAGAPGA